MRYLLICLALIFLGCESVPDFPKDEYIWLEDVEGEKSIGWVKSFNEKTLGVLESHPNYKKYLDQTTKILEAKDKIPYGSIRGKRVYNYWRDDKHVRGLWRSATINSYNSKRTRWRTLLDLDKLAKKENENWVWKGADCLPPKYQRCLIRLSRGGKDATVVREFDVPTRKFVKDGFYLKEAKSRVSWYNLDTIVVGTDYGKGSMTTSGYPRILKAWKRGTDLASAKTIFEGDMKDVSAWSYRAFRSEGPIFFIGKQKTFYSAEYYLADENGVKKRIPVPDDAEFIEVFKDRFLFVLRSDWNYKGHDFPQGSLASMGLSGLLRDEVKVESLYIPDQKSAVRSVSTTKDFILVDQLFNVNSQILKISQKKEGGWKTEELPAMGTGSKSILSTSYDSNSVYLNYSGFTEPPQVLFLNSETGKTKTAKTQPERFNSKNLVVSQEFAKSKDGTLVPYFLVHSNKMKRDGKVPTLLYGYGGFEISLTPFYWSTAGKLWLENGGALAIANIRGGGEFGPRWHQAALKTNRQKAFDDFISVAEDLIKQNVTSREHLGIKGGSNGGLLVGASFVQRPDLFDAVICSVPLLDMVRYSQLLAGASWIGEYGDPKNPKMRKYLLSYSPYHKVKKEAEYPEVFFITSTKDDRVHPAHARKMAAKMNEFGHKVFYYENIEGGHSASANLKQRAKMTALEYVYLDIKLRN